MSSLGAAPDTEELAQFRATWKKEIREQAEYQSRPDSKSLALATYTVAVAEEQRGNHTEATKHYRIAFRLDPNVEKSYRNQEAPPSGDGSGSMSVISVIDLPLADINADPPSQTVLTITRRLSSLVGSWSQPLHFAPEDETIGVPINLLPNDVIILILCYFSVNMDVNSIERFAMVSRRARMLSLDLSVWRQLLLSTLVPAQRADPSIPLNQLAAQYGFDYRRVFVEHPRLRLDGVYIAVCHYVRHGLAENPWVTVSHLVTYRRFLRFLPNGDALSYRANDDKDVGEIVRSLQPGLKRKGLFVGTWQLTGTKVLIKDLTDTSPSGHTGVQLHSFEMSLTLKSRPSLGRWNRLDFDRYGFFNIATGDVQAFPLYQERPFWFSKVKSYYQ